MQSLSLSILTAIFPSGPGLAGTRMSPFWILLELRMMDVVVTTGAIRYAKLHSNCYYHQANTQLLSSRIPFPLPNQQCHCRVVSVISSTQTQHRHLFKLSCTTCNKNNSTVSMSVTIAWNFRQQFSHMYWCTVALNNLICKYNNLTSIA